LKKSPPEPDPGCPTLWELEGAGPVSGIEGPGRWLVFFYLPTALFSLKTSRATSTAGKTLLVPTPYAVKMAFIDSALRHGLAEDPDWLVRSFAQVRLHIGVPEAACVTGTTQRVRQETRPEDRKKDPALARYQSTIAMREVAHLLGRISLAYDLSTCGRELISLLTEAAAGVNYFGKRGSFAQYCGRERRVSLDQSFTQLYADVAGTLPGSYHVAVLDDFGFHASFNAVNSFSNTTPRRDRDRVFVDTVVPLGVRSFGSGFVYYARKALVRLPD
jgi:hypothetical protein